MVSSSVSAILRLGGWSYIPDFATRQVLNVFHRLYPTIFNTPPPMPRTPQYVKHYRRAFAVVVLGYLTYNFIEASSTMRPNLYEILGVTPEADDGALKNAFRQFARKNHPDRVGPQGEALFIEVRDAYEALKDPVKRYAYDRFGHDVLQWSTFSTVREYLRHGLMQASGFHIVTGIALLLFGSIGRPSPVAFWRFTLFFALFASELYLVLSPSPTPRSSPLASATGDEALRTNILYRLFPRRVPYQHVLLLHQIFLFMSVALSRVAPVLFPEISVDPQSVDRRLLNVVLERLNALGTSLDSEALAMLHTELHAIHRTDASFATHGILPSTNEDTMTTLSREMEDMFVEARLAREAQAGPLRALWDAALRRGRSALQRSPSRAAISFATTGSPSVLQRSPSKRDLWGQESPPKMVRRRTSNWWEQAQMQARANSGIGRRADDAIEVPDNDGPQLPTPDPSASPPDGGSMLPSAEESWIDVGPRTPLRRRESYQRGRSVSC